MLNFNFKPLRLDPEDEQAMAAILARVCFLANPEIDELEAFDLCDEYIREGGSLDVEGITLLIRLVRAETLFDPMRHAWN